MCSFEMIIEYLRWEGFVTLLGRSLMIGWRKKSWNPERVPTVVTLCVRVSVRVSVRARPTGHIFWPSNLIFGLNDPWDMRKKRIFLLFEIFTFTLFMDIFRFFPYITLVIFCFQATGHNFSPRDMIFGLREPCIIRNWKLLTFFENSIFYA